MVIILIIFLVLILCINIWIGKKCSNNIKNNIKELSEGEYLIVLSYRTISDGYMTSFYTSGSLEEAKDKADLMGSRYVNKEFLTAKYSYKIFKYSDNKILEV